MEKGYMQSQTIVGAIKLIVPIVVSIASILGLEIRDLENALQEGLISLVTVVLSLWGLYDVIIGRLKATKSVNVGVPYIK
jgi:hypothetical protein